MGEEVYLSPPEMKIQSVEIIFALNNGIITSLSKIVIKYKLFQNIL